MSENKTQPGKLDKINMQVTQQVFHNLIEVVELYPKYTISQHLASILRRKSEEGKQFYYWNNDQLLKRIEQHKSELEGDQFMSETEDNEY